MNAIIESMFDLVQADLSPIFWKADHVEDFDIVDKKGEDFFQSTFITTDGNLHTYRITVEGETIEVAMIVTNGIKIVSHFKKYVNMQIEDDGTPNYYRGQKSVTAMLKGEI